MTTRRRRARPRAYPQDAQGAGRQQRRGASDPPPWRGEATTRSRVESAALQPWIALLATGNADAASESRGWFYFNCA